MNFSDILDVLSLHMSQITIAPTYTKRHLQRDDSMPLFPLASLFRTTLRHMYARKSIFCLRTRKGPTSLGFSVLLLFFGLSFFSFSCLSVAVVGLFLGLLQVQEFPRKHQERKFLEQRSQVYLRDIFHQVFLSNF